MNDELRMLVLRRASARNFAGAAIAAGMQTLRQDAFVKVQEVRQPSTKSRRVLV